mmetsp:Transcript_8789/g.21746  ORF Transcript_8789/g.21746 Transcript_8789/m.21746 type:complete len:236 (+) Transcript_8789:419-1126(+)
MATPWPGQDTALQLRCSVVVVAVPVVAVRVLLCLGALGARLGHARVLGVGHAGPALGVLAHLRVGQQRGVQLLADLGLIHVHADEHNLLAPVAVAGRVAHVPVGQDHVALRRLGGPVLVGHRRPPVTLVPELKVLPRVAPVVGSGVAVGQPHKALGAQHSLDGRVAGVRRLAVNGLVGGHGQPLEHLLLEPLRVEGLAPAVHKGADAKALGCCGCLALVLVLVLVVVVLVVVLAR